MLQWFCGWLIVMASAGAMIPREKLVSDSTITQPSLSPDGTTVGFITADTNKIKNVFTLRLSDHLKRQVSFEEIHVKYFQWTAVKDVIIFAQDRNGDENDMLFKRNISETTPTHESVAISRAPGVTAGIQANNQKDSHVLIAMNDADQKYHNVYKFDLYTDELSLVFANSRFASSYIYTDNNMNIRFASEQEEDGGMIYYRVSPNASSEILTSDDDQWLEYMRVKPDDVYVTKFIGFDETNEHVCWIIGEDTDLGQLIVTPFSNFFQQKVLHTAAHGELQNFLFHPEDNTLLAFSEYYHKPQIVFYKETVAEDLRFLIGLRPADSLNIIGMSQDLDTWLYTYQSWESPNEIFVYHRQQQSSELLFNLNSELEGYTLNKQIGFDFFARDGLRIQAYLSLPPNEATKSASEVSEEDKRFAEQGMIPVHPQKMVLLVHGGPTARDSYGFNAVVAHLTSRGYAVLQVNFRGSLGLGKHLCNAGNGEWSRKMHSDLLDAVEFAVSKGIANRSSVAIMGTSYGGYAALTGLTFTPDVFACGVDIVGPANLITLIDSIPPYWAAYRNSLIRKFGGDSATEDGKRELKARSPVSIADRVRKPLIIMQGANDPRVKQNESEQFVAELNKHSIPVTYVLYPDEGHGFKRTPNRLAQFGFVERFLHSCLGGEYQPFTNGQYNESAIVKSDGY